MSGLLEAALRSMGPGDGGYASVRLAVRALAVTGRLSSRPGGALDAARAGAQPALPVGWEWKPFCDVAEIASNLVPPKDFLDLPHVAPDNIEKGTGKLLEYRTVREDGVISGKHRFYSGQLLYSKIRPNLSKVVCVDFDGLCSADMYPLNPRIERRYLWIFLLSPIFLDQVVRGDNRIAMPKVNQEQLSATLVSVPPVAEQKRIVAKVDELMKLIDDLEARQTKATATQSRFRTSALDALTKADGPAQLAVAWKRVAGNFEVLFEQAESVAGLRRVVRDLAVVGRVVEQRTGEGDGRELLPQLHRDVEAAGGKWSDPRSDEIAAETGAWIPPSWAWVRLATVATFGPRNGYSPKAVDYPTAVKTLTLTATTSGRFKPEHVKYIDEEVAPESDLWLREGDILIQRSNSIDYVGMAAVFHGPGNTFIYPDLMMKVRLSSGLDIDFAHLVLLSTPTRHFYRARATGTAGSMPKINQAVVSATPIPLPPLAEQKRIVAKVEALMKLCDDLEAKLKTKEATASRLVEAVVRELVA